MQRTATKGLVAEGLLAFVLLAAYPGAAQCRSGGLPQRILLLLSSVFLRFSSVNQVPLF